MPTETGRVIKRKRVNLPSGNTVDIAVITQITFLDVVAQGQEYEFHIENSGTANRDVHVATIPGGGAATDESGGGGGSDLKVERVDVWRVLDVVDRGQESFIHLDNKTFKEPPDAPPYFTTHEKTHIVKYINTPDDGNWIKSELIDRFKVLDVVDQSQENEYFLFNPPDNSGISGLTLGTDSDGNPTVAVDTGLPDISDSGTVDPPWRTDPFQNIVDFSSSRPGIDVFWLCTGTPITASDADLAPYQCNTIGPATQSMPPGAALVCGWEKTLSFSMAAGQPTQPGFTWSGGPSTPTPVSFDSMKWLPYVWLMPRDHGGADKIFTGRTSASATVGLFGVSISGGSLGFYSDVPGNGFWANGYTFGGIVDAGSTVTAVITLGLGHYNGIDYECYSTQIDFVANGFINTPQAVIGFRASFKVKGSPDP